MTTQKHQKQYVQRAVFARKGALSYIGHLDLMRCFERAIRRAELPILYSQGYNPRPMMVFALPLGVGIHTEGDVVDVPMSVPVDPEEFITKVNEELPVDLKILSSVSIPEPKDSLMSIVAAADYRIEAKGIGLIATNILEYDEVITTKKSKGKQITVDIRSLILDVRKVDDDSIILSVAAGSSKNLRPDVFMNALCTILNFDSDEAKDACVTRIALYKEESDKLSKI